MFNLLAAVLVLVGIEASRRQWEETAKVVPSRFRVSQTCSGHLLHNRMDAKHDVDLIARAESVRIDASQRLVSDIRIDIASAAKADGIGLEVPSRLRIEVARHRNLCCQYKDEKDS